MDINEKHKKQKIGRRFDAIGCPIAHNKRALAFNNFWLSGWTNRAPIYAGADNVLYSAIRVHA